VIQGVSVDGISSEQTRDSKSPLCSTVRRPRQNCSTWLPVSDGGPLCQPKCTYSDTVM